MKKKRKIAIAILIGFVVLGLLLLISSKLESPSSTKIIETDNKEEKDESEIDWSDYKVYNVKLSSGNVSITKAGVYYISGTLKKGMITIETNDNVKLVLDNVTITSKSGPAIYIKESKGVYIELKGESTVNANATTNLDAAIYSKADLYLYGEGTLNIKSNYDGITSKDDLYLLSGTYDITADKDGIKGKDTVTIQNGTYTITSKEDGIKTTNEEEKGEIVIENGTFKITSSQDGIQAQSTLMIENGTFVVVAGTTASSDESQKGLKAQKSVTIKNGTYTITSVDDCIHSNEDVTIDAGTYELSTNDDAIHADGTVTIKDGTVQVIKSYEGIEGFNINLEGGTINVVASDDGVNVGGGKDSSGTANGRKDAFDQDSGGLLNISGGTIYVNSGGDGLDSNGSIKVSRGVIHVDGPTNNGNGALDYNGTFEITGGELIAVGSSGMAQNVSSSSTQNTILVNLSSQASGDISIGSISYSPSKSYQSILISSSSLELNHEYTLTTGSSSQTVTLTSTVTGGGNGMMNPGMMNQGGNRGRR